MAAGSAASDSDSRASSFGGRVPLDQLLGNMELDHGDMMAAFAGGNHASLNRVNSYDGPLLPTLFEMPTARNSSRGSSTCSEHTERTERTLLNHLKKCAHPCLAT